MIKALKNICIFGVLFLGTLVAHAGNFDLKGVFLIVDESGFPLGGVEVSCQFNDESWKTYGTSQPNAMELGDGYIKKGAEVNFVQYQPCFPRGNSTVTWRFRKSGYNEVTVSEKMPSYTKGTGQDAEIFRKVKMTKIREGSRLASSLNTPSGAGSGFFCTDCFTELVRFDPWKFYCPYCRKGKCPRCDYFYHPTYQAIQGEQLVKDYGVYCGCTEH